MVAPDQSSGRYRSLCKNISWIYTNCLAASIWPINVENDIGIFECNFVLVIVKVLGLQRVEEQFRLVTVVKPIVSDECDVQVFVRVAVNIIQVVAH